MKPSKEKIYELLDKYSKLRGKVEKPLFSDRMFAKDLLAKFIDAEKLKKKFKYNSFRKLDYHAEPVIDELFDLDKEIDNLLKEGKTIRKG